MRYFIYSFLVSLASVIFSLSVAPILLGKLAYLISPILLLLVFFALFSDINLALFYVLITGFLFDLYSPYFFGFYSLLLLGELAAIKFFVYYFLRHQNLFTYLILNLLAIIIWHLFLGLANLFNDFNLGDFIIKVFYQSVTHLIIILVAYKFWPYFKFKLSSNLIS